MDLCVLKQKVAALGFDPNVSADAFIYAVNRALQRVDTLFPVVKGIDFLHSPPENLAKDADHKIRFKGNTNLSFSSTAAIKAYSFECNGNGTAVLFGVSASGVETRVASISLSSTGGFVRYTGFLTGSYAKAKLTFTGSYSYYVRNVAFYAYLKSASAEDIPPYCEVCEYDLRKLIDSELGYAGFGGLVSVRTGDLVECEQYRVEGEKLFAPFSSSALFNIRYYRFPPEIGEDYTGELDVDDRVSELLPLYVAGYAWLDDYPDKASYYIGQFEKEAAERVRLKKATDTVRIKRKGWS